MAIQSNPTQAPTSLQIEDLALSSLTPDPANARRHSKQQIRKIATSIERFAFNSPILVDRDLKVISGHGRLEACRFLGRPTVPVIRLEHLSPEQARAFAIAENRLVELSSWDERVLGEHFKALAAIDLDFSLEDTGFSMTEIDLAIEGLGVGARTDPADDLPPIGPAVCQVGDLWLLGEHKVLCGDALDEGSYDALLGLERVAAVFADPPYNVAIDGHVSGKGRRRHREFAMAVGEKSGPEFVIFLSRACENAAAFSLDGAVHFICMDWRHVGEITAAGRAAYSDLLNICVWTKNNGGMGSLYRSAHELVFVFRKGQTAHRNNVQLGRFGRNRTNVWSYPGANSFLRTAEDADLMAQHPTPKPVALVADALLDVTARRDLVLDPFLGSGSTLIAAERIGRRARGIELDPLYVDLTIRRWQRLTGEDAVLSGTGATFSELEEKGR